MLWIARDDENRGGATYLFQGKPVLIDGVWTGPSVYVRLPPSQTEFEIEPGAGPCKARVHFDPVEIEKL